MNAYTSQSTEQQMRKGASDLLSYTFFHLVKELRGAEVQGPPKEMPPSIKAILSSALFGAIDEVMSILKDEDWSSEWEQSSRAWALLTVYGDTGVSEAREYVERINSTPNELAEFRLCGMYAARNLVQALSDGSTHDGWLDSHEGMFAAMARLQKVI